MSLSQAGLRGDLNRNGLPDVADAIGILRIVVGLDPANALADCDGDGNPGIADAILVLRCVVGLDGWPLGGVTETIGPGGGTVTTVDGNVLVDVPSGALDADTDITVSPQSTWPIAAGVVPGTCYEFGPDGTQFSQPAQLTITYDQTRLPAGMDETTLAVHKVSGNAWEAVAGSSVDADANRVSAPINGFSTYAALGVVREAGEEIAGPDGQTLVWVPGGSFMMGGPYGNEQPIHQVTLDGFWVGQCEVTNAQYGAFCTATGRDFPPYSEQGDDHPIVYVTWYDAQAYCDHHGYTLPTEAQWEYVARGPDAPVYPWGDAWDAQKCCNSENTGPGGRTFPVGSFLAGASWCGALDMAGNVGEWCADWFSPTYYEVSPELNPPGPESGTSRVYRGGSWLSNATPCLAHHRTTYGQAPYLQGTTLGFRVCRRGL